MHDINNKIAKGAAWMLAFKMIDKLIGLASTIVLARMLVPDDFGLVAMAMLLIGALNLLISFGFDISLIQNPKAGRDQFDTAWTVTMIFAVSCAAVLALLAQPAAAFYHEPRLELVIYILAFAFAAQGCSNIGPVIFRREMRFDQEFKFLLSKRLATFLVTIPLALYLQNYWALIMGQLSGTLLSVAVSYIVSDYRPRLSLKAKIELFNNSKWLIANNFFNFLNNSSAQFIIGRLSGAQTLGVYTVAAEISTMPTTELIAPINRAAFPGYAKAAADRDTLRASFLNVIASIALFALPAGVGIVTVADLLVPAVLGWKWVEAIPVIQILAVYGVIQGLQTNIGYIYLALGNLRQVTIIAGAQSVMLIVLLTPAIYYHGVLGAAWASLATIIVMIPVNQFLIARCLALSWSMFLGKLTRPMLASLVMAGAVFLVKSMLTLRPVTLDYLLALLLCAACGALVYGLVVFGLWRMAGAHEGPERFVVLRLERLLARVGMNISLAGVPGRR
jgi:lipopolysaccharide exporter